MIPNRPIFPWTTIRATPITQVSRQVMREYGAREAMRERMEVGELESLYPSPIINLDRLREVLERSERTPAEPHPGLIEDLDLGSEYDEYEYDEEETPQEKILNGFDYETVEPWKGLSDSGLRELDQLYMEISSLVERKPKKSEGTYIYKHHSDWSRRLRSVVQISGMISYMKRTMNYVLRNSIDDKAILAGLVYCVFVPLEDLLESADPAGSIAARNYARHVYTQVQKKVFAS